MPKATQNATHSDRQARALQIAYEYLVGELRKANRGEVATVTLRRARSAMNAIADALLGMGVPPPRQHLLFLSRGFALCLDGRSPASADVARTAVLDEIRRIGMDLAGELGTVFKLNLNGLADLMQQSMRCLMVQSVKGRDLPCGNGVLGLHELKQDAEQVGRIE